MDQLGDPLGKDPREGKARWHSIEGYMLTPVLLLPMNTGWLQRLQAAVVSAAKKVPYALASLAENPFTLAAAIFYALLILYGVFDYLLTSFDVTHTVVDAMASEGVTLFLVSVVLVRVRNSPGYVEFLAQNAGSSASTMSHESLAGRLPYYRSHAKAIERIGNKVTMGHFDPIIRMAQLVRKAPPNKTLSFRQIAYGIELDLVGQYRRLPRPEGQAPFKLYYDRYKEAFREERITAEKWANFMLAVYEDLPPEVKAQAESKTEFSFMERVEKHLGFFTLLSAIIAIAGVLVAVFR